MYDMTSCRNLLIVHFNSIRVQEKGVSLKWPEFTKKSSPSLSSPLPCIQTLLGLAQFGKEGQFTVYSLYRVHQEIVSSYYSNIICWIALLAWTSTSMFITSWMELVLTLSVTPTGHPDQHCFLTGSPVSECMSTLTWPRQNNFGNFNFT